MAEMKGIEVSIFKGNTAGMRVYTKKSSQVSAAQVDQTFWVNNSMGLQQGKEGDYLVRDIGVRGVGELYICDKEIFEKSYELR